MTVTATIPRVQYTITSANVSSLADDAGSVTFTVTFKYLATSEVVATQTSSGTDTVLTETTHYTLSAAGASGTFTFTVAGAALFAADDLLTFTRKMERTGDTFDQLSDYAQNDALDADTLENNFDKAIMIEQQMKEAADRRLHFSETSTFDSTSETASKISATKADRASKYLSFDADGDITTSITVDGVSYTETSIAAGDILVYNGSAFVNTKLLPRITQILDSSGNEVIKFGTTGSAVNEITVTNAATGNPPTISATGEADKGIDFENSEGEELLKLASVSSAVNEVKISNAATGDNPTISATGEADTGITFENSESEEILILDATATAVNEITITNAIADGAPTLSATGDDTNIDITLTPKGTGEVVIGTGSASGKITTNSAQDLVLDTNSGENSGTITITDGANGNIDITPNGTGEVNISKVDIDGGTINGITDLAVADGGTGASSAGDARTNLGVDPAGTDNSTNVTLSGTPDYITLSGQAITRNQIDLSNDVTGTLPVGNGGTGITGSYEKYCKAWVKFSASGSIGASFNIAAVNNSDGTGLYTITLTSTFSGDATVVGCTGVSNDGSFMCVRTHVPQGDAAFKVLTRNYSGTVVGNSYNSVLVFGA